MRKFVAAIALCALPFAANAADLGVRPAYKAPVVAPSHSPMHDWSGFYLGAHGGYAWGELTSANDVTIDHEPSGWLFGGHVGMNWQFNRLVLGIEGDISYTKIDGDDTTTFGNFTINLDHQMKYLATVRGRIGYAHDRVLAYVTGGAAFAEVVGNVNVVGVVTGSDKVNLTGWTIGGGLEFALSSNWSVRAEYLYVDFKEATTSIDLGFPFTDDFDMNLSIVRVGATYKFGGRAPVMARY